MTGTEHGVELGLPKYTAKLAHAGVNWVFVSGIVGNSLRYNGTAMHLFTKLPCIGTFKHENIHISHVTRLA